MLGRLVLPSMVVLVLACNGGSSTTCPAGTLRCECYRNKTCNAGLSCYSDRCVASAGPLDADVRSSGGAIGAEVGPDSPASAGGAPGGTGAGGAPGNGGAPAADAALGDASGAGGAGVGGLPGLGGKLGTGGAPAIDAGHGGGPGTGGLLGTGGKPASGGTPGSGGGPGSGGIVGSGGTPGTGGLASGGSGGSSGTYQVTFNFASPVYRTELHGYLVGTTSQNEGVIVGAIGAGPAQAADPGPTIRWYSSTGTLKREKTFPQAPTPVAIAVASDDSLWLVGSLSQSSANFGGATLAKADWTYYLVHLAADGSHLLSMAVTSSELVWLASVTTDSSGNVYVGGSLMNSDYSATNAFVRKLASNGTMAFERSFAGGSTTAVFDLALTPAGDIAIVGQFRGTVTFGTTSLTSKTNSSGTSAANGFVAVLSAANGTPSMARSFGGTTEDIGYAVQVTASGALRVGGYVTGAGEVGGKTVNSGSSSDTPFVAELDPATGAANWVRVLGGDGAVFKSVTDAAGRTFAVGRFEGPGTGPGRTVGSSSFVALVQSDGSSKVIMQTLTNGNGAMRVALDGLGGLWIGGEYMGSANFGLGPVVPTGTVGVTDFASYALYLKPL